MSVITKPHIESEIAVYTLKGPVSPEVLDNFFSNLEQHRVILKSLKVVAVLFSFKEITKISNDDLDRLYKRFEELNGEMKIPTGFTNYTSKQYVKIKKDVKDTSLALVKTPKVAAIVMGTARISKSDTVLVYDDDLDEKHLMFSEFISKGYSVVAAKDREDFKERAAHREIYGKIVRESKLSGIYRTVFTTFLKEYYTYIFRGYIDDSLSTLFNQKAHFDRLDDGFRGFMLDFSKVSAVHIRAAFFLKELEESTRKKGGEIFIFGTNQKKLGSNVTEVIRNSGVEFYDTYDECLAQAKEKNVVRIHKDTSGHKIVMTKELIQNISLFAKSTVSTINVFSGKRAESKLVRKSAESMLKKDFYTFGMLSFDGDLCGTIFFFGYEKLLKEIAKVMLEDSNPDKQTAVDLTSEIMNTIGGKVKTAISKLNIPISISLPKSFGDKNQVAAIIENREGVSVNLKIEDNEFYLFIIGENLQEAL